MNGNGRHSRLMADILIEKLLGGKIFTWGQVSLSRMGYERKRYIDSIMKADKGDIKPLIEFARSSIITTGKCPMPLKQT